MIGQATPLGPSLGTQMRPKAKSNQRLHYLREKIAIRCN